MDYYYNCITQRRNIFLLFYRCSKSADQRSDSTPQPGCHVRLAHSDIETLSRGFGKLKSPVYLYLINNMPLWIIITIV